MVEDYLGELDGYIYIKDWGYVKADPVEIGNRLVDEFLDGIDKIFKNEGA